MEQKIPVAKILKPYGVRNQCVLFSFSGDFNLKSYRHYYISFDSKEYESLDIHKSKPYLKGSNKYLIELGGYDRNGIERLLVGEYIYVDSLNYSQLKEEEFFYQDVIGCLVYIEEKLVGSVIGVYNFGYHDILEVKKQNDESKKLSTLFFPIQKEFLTLFDLDKKTIVFNSEMGEV